MMGLRNLSGSLRPSLRVLACSAIVCGALCGAGPASAEGGHVVDVHGSVELGRGTPANWTPLHRGDRLQPGDAIRTGADGRAELVIGAATLRLYEDSVLRLPGAAAAAEAGTRLGLERGRSLFDVLRSAADRGLEIETREVVVSVKGTRFGVDAEAQSVDVFRGAVGVRDRLDAALEEVLVPEGFALMRGTGGMLELLATSAQDPWPLWERGGSFPAHPDPDTSFAPRARELESARRAARQAAKPRALERAMERHPELQERIERAVAKRAADGSASGDQAPPIDGVVDDPRRAHRTVLAQRYAQLLANGTGGGGGGGGGGSPGGGNGNGLTVTFVSGSGVSGGDQIRIEDASSGFSTSFDEGFVDDVLDGSASFPTEISDALTQQGVTENQFAHALMVIFETN